MIKEYNIIQNSGIGALILHSFISEFYITTDKMRGPSLPLLMPILPIIYNKDSTSKLYNRHKKTSSFYLSLAEERLIPVGLQERMVRMTNQTFSSLNLAFATNILTYVKNRSELIPTIDAYIPKLIFEDNKKMIKASKLLGYWFAKLTVEEIMIALNIKF